MKKTLSIVSLFLLIGIWAGKANANIIVNGGFEEGMTGWSVSGADDYDVSSYGGVHGGSFNLWGYDNDGYATLSQTVNTTIGELYNFSFWSRTNYDVAANILGYSFDNGATIFTVNRTTSWAETATSFIASSNSTTIEFYFQTDSGTGTWHFDDVSLVKNTAAPVPLPSAVILFGSGIAGIIGLRRRNNR